MVMLNNQRVHVKKCWKPWLLRRNPLHQTSPEFDPENNMFSWWKLIFQPSSWERVYVNFREANEIWRLTQWTNKNPGDLSENYGKS
jgi:hypothetical protein